MSTLALRWNYAGVNWRNFSVNIRSSTLSSASVPPIYIVPTYNLPTIPGSMLLDAYISSKEEQVMGINSQGTVEYRDDFWMMKSECYVPALEEHEDVKPSVKQKRKHTTSIVYHHTKELKKNLINSP
ncbi:hypothetical protein AGABI1DRAFT_133983 [Agaricus bisporus var. burnettii JB137-S8]|uniref:Uncharacterized protein n=1 Tax=Agaricus bisporus var. burnettii (strain JB137-S8 / ATCC MYA-4627 / FGSC 10392) TaxID=597362 RepID=K5WSX2_AGABU|nr:uncharacterized protein AGABI1DRAFT_133983 [Agaricus bisporus var. burnettii JB137-S8]EKM73848.1 hypothetical protein AGABI1DRAFT_133983 [Agaricus bisporus var. burnettii JB137-S8]